MLGQRCMQVVLILCLLLVLWQCFRAPTDGLSPFPGPPLLLDTPATCCTAVANGSAWFNTHYDMAMGPLLKGTAHELSSDVVQWWLTLQGHPNSVQVQAIIQQLFTVFRVPTSALWDPSRCRTCAVVGNSGRLKGSGHGLQIDGHDWVLRMNRAKIAGFELDVGTRTTHHFMYPESAVNLRPGVHLVLVPFKPLDLQWVASAFSTGELTHTYVRVKRFIKADRNKVLILSPAFLKYIHDNWTQHHGRYPSTGFTALLFALHACQQVSVFGFGADSEGNWHHYWEKNRWSGAFRRTRVHDADVEFSLIETLAVEGRILFYK
ncbi:CMP-N-acetylneuraminate-beta-galactosamide-alpha-2,3-sialyltransferase 2-like isoform X1 [Falco biarmicus]|uniref:CMP-N-acetylneuraminate-beta-galactosamide- alpha-2,3-sialyltransferase 2-like isoform X1 n=2 Tax=Falco peregrinus TaxID=8954 RepID=UPI0003870EB0|nr:CMP-N-acetylneuraminate-beta-galactosamide-alpha-2,3-sialyltransferase 2-like isoform X1 [Falco peregrinus]XP_027653574.1 CMP-N-acetylneuraminate-beta-galactosamide-alpha-2,3-sialyltransferase 2-like isoform X1 [Falco cherrug]XP_037257388.1 CMP-N-acetylneuraminate-beta-galactosamide-alpha-2,3-sialyltransferase 2-like isoform X1 [Falco rusticolus]XP_037257389.1 CMP-N-acetylneuraminate-beta-galactosamide-alpha-2,3-sialyltransferase 2-like isoform X1 [Falco rusticolus]XP_056209759.1 CMP-N-acety